MYCQGLNRYTFHRYAMQPWTNRWPGMTMGQWGFHFERTVTWWDQGKPWIDYITHCQFLLQQGRAVADVAYFTGQSVPVEMRVGSPSVPFGYDYDAIDADVLLHGAVVRDGRIVLKSGASYAALVLPPNDINMTPEFMACLRQLVAAGATVVGPRPQHSPSLAGYPRCDSKVKKIADQLWGNCDGTSIMENSFEKGRVIFGKSLADVLWMQNLRPDFDFVGGSPGTHLEYAHRTTGDADIYFVSNQRRQFDSAACVFRIRGRIPELWHPDTGLIEKAPFYDFNNGRTVVRLDFDPAGSVFVIFRQPADSSDHIVAASGQFNSQTTTAPKLQIQNAVYAAVDGAGEKDVTGLLSSQVSDGQLVASVGNDTLGGDPTVNHEKELRLTYVLDGSTNSVTAHEGDTLTLPAKLTLHDAPEWGLSTAANGLAAVTTWANGSIELHTATGKTLRTAITNMPAPQEIAGDWNLSFPPNWGAPPSVVLDHLISWTDSTNPGVRYFSGTATYDKDIEIPADDFTPDRQVWIDLGTVKEFAQVSLNGHDFGVLWKPPFRVNVTSAAKPGANKLTVKVTNLWPNRLIGDEQLPPDVEWRGKELRNWPQWFLDGKASPTGRLTFTTWHHYYKDSSLLESGLIGPVLLKTAEVLNSADMTVQTGQ